MPRPLISACLLALAGFAPLAAIAQTTAAPVAGDADRLAAQMRLLGANPNDLSALLSAGELSVALDDLGAAASFFARADRIDPRNGRAKAGEAAILVHAERPGEALRYFALAESDGLAPAAFASDRGLAYDLIGEQERAQRDYRLALRTAPTEETRRRYALSLAIAGKRELAEQQLQPLLRQSDRGAWRVHAFVLAMGGNVAEASRIATTMMPPGTAAGLQPFLEKLPRLGAVDRAFAVHFGEVASTPQRVADARLAPSLPALGPDPDAPRAPVAAVATTDKAKKRGPKRRDKQVASVVVATPAPEPLPQAPAYRPQPGTPPVLATRGAAPGAWPTGITPETRRSAPSAVAAAAPPPETNVVVGAPIGSSPNRVASRHPSSVVAAAPPVSPPTLDAARATALAKPSAVAAVATRRTDTAVAATTPPATTPLAGAAPAQPAASTPVAIAAAPPSTTANPAAVPPAAVPPAATAVQGTAPGAWPTAITPDTPRPSLAAVAPPVEAPAPVRRRQGSDLSTIVAGLPIPASELGVAAPTPADDAAAIAKAAADKRAADRKAAADKKALADKKAAAAKKAEEEREAAARKKIERANPERIWVQVAGGANTHDLTKAWAAAKAKGGDVFAGHATGWTTPLRFTNRVLAGPFKTDADARAFVNKAKAAGLSPFTFTSDAGQVVTKLPTS